MSPPAKKRTKKKKRTPKPQSTLIPSLPDDLWLSCFARISRLYYPTLSLVSKSFRSLIASPELYKVRSLLGRTESCLYVYISAYDRHRWFTLCLKPDEIIRNGDTRRKKNEQSKPRGYALATVPDTLSRDAFFHGIVAVGSEIYCINPQKLEPVPFSRLDCRSHTWRHAPSLPVTLRPLFSACVVDQKIYLAGSDSDVDDGGSGYYKKLVSVFDTETQAWDRMPIPWSLENGYIFKPTTCIDGKLHVMHLLPGTCDDAVVAYDSKQGRWDPAAPEMSELLLMDSDSNCEIENVLYAVFGGEIRWYDTKVSEWRKLMGLVGLPKFPLGDNDLGDNDRWIRLADYGGKMAAFWDETQRIWCAQIALEKRQNCEIWGKVEWVDHVLTLSHSPFQIVKVLAATV